MILGEEIGISFQIKKIAYAIFFYSLNSIKIFIVNKVLF